MAQTTIICHTCGQKVCVNYPNVCLVPTISNRNGKLGKFIYHFSISVKSCAYATEHCKTYCYAKKGKVNIHQNTTYMNNYEASKQDTFVDYMTELLKPLAMDLRYFRIHTSGDFYSQAYFNKWVQLAERFGSIKFLAFTRNRRIDTRHAPSNLILIYSRDPSTKADNPTIARSATVSYTDSESDDYVCRDKCANCRVCWDTDYNIVFPIRQVSKDTLIKLM